VNDSSGRYSCHVELNRIKHVFVESGACRIPFPLGHSSDALCLMYMKASNRAFGYGKSLWEIKSNQFLKSMQAKRGGRAKSGSAM